jgi:cation:H+ antiporter
MMALLLLVGGLVVLSAGAELLVRGAARLAMLARVSPLVIGLTVVAYGTSAPELTVSAVTAWQGRPEIALGNAIGSNIFNVLFILGLSALIVPLNVNVQLLRFDVPLMIGASFLVWAVAFDGSIGLLDGLVFLTLLGAYTGWSIRASRRETAAMQAEYAAEFGAPTEAPVKTPSVLSSLLLALVGLVLLIVGSKWFVEGAVEIARWLRLDERVIGLTLVAAGTSLPEAATSVVAALKGERDIAVGNVIGSNLFNILGVLGSAAVLGVAAGEGGIHVPESYLRFDIPVMFTVALACLPIFFAGHTIYRWNGALLLFYQIVYTAWLLMGVYRDPSLPTLRYAVLVFFMPITLILLAIDLWRHWSVKHRRTS